MLFQIGSLYRYARAVDSTRVTPESDLTCLTGYLRDDQRPLEEVGHAPAAKKQRPVAAAEVNSPPDGGGGGGAAVVVDPPRKVVTTTTTTKAAKATTTYRRKIQTNLPCRIEAGGRYKKLNLVDPRA